MEWILGLPESDPTVDSLMGFHRLPDRCRVMVPLLLFRAPAYSLSAMSLIQSIFYLHPPLTA